MSDKKPCTDCPDKLQTPMTVAELRGLLAEYSGDTPVWVNNDEFGTYWRPEPRRVRVKPGKSIGHPAWREDCDDSDPRAVEGIYL